MSLQNSPLKIAKRLALVAAPLVIIHLGAILIWSSKASNRITDECLTSYIHCSNRPWTLASPLNFYSNSEPGDWIQMHFFSIIALIISIVLFVAVAAICYWVTTGKLWFAAEPADDTETPGIEEEDDTIPCKNPQCGCATHQNEEFVTEWQPTD